jgi:hypothetical protein
MGIGKVFVNNKPESNTLGGILPLSKGGTSSMNTDGAANQLTALDFDLRNAPNGVVGLNEQRKVCNELFTEETWDAAISIDGPVSVIVNSINEYTIGRYSNFNDYNITSDAGNINRVNETITLTAPAAPGVITLTINGKSFSIDVVPATTHVNTPSITSPVTGATNLGPDIAITSSLFSATGGSDTHEGTDWQIATDANFTNIVASATNSSTDKLSWAVQGLQPATQYFIRTRYKGVSMGYSNWSSSISLTTKANYLPTTEEAILTASDKAQNALFGYACAISGDGSRCIVGAHQANNSRGKAYVFIRSGTTWTQEYILDDGIAGNAEYSFGVSVDIDNTGTRVVIGAYYYTSEGGSPPYAGRVYVYVRSGTTWARETILYANDAAASDYLGFSTSMTSDGSRVVAGAYGADPYTISTAGKAYIFTRSGTTWSQEAILIASDADYQDNFGYSVDISGNGTRCIVGAFTANIGGSSDAGKAYIFSRSGSTWTQEAILNEGAFISANNYFGCSVSISNDGSRCIVGATISDLGGVINAGAAYIFIRSGTTWTQEAKLTANDAAASDQFGSSVCISNDSTMVIVGANIADSSGVANCGKVYAFTRTGSTWTQVNIYTASNKAQNDGFSTGASIDISDNKNYIVIGAYSANPSGLNDAGSAYIFS